MVMFSKLRASAGMWLCSSDTPVACLMIFRLIPSILSTALVGSPVEWQEPPCKHMMLGCLHSCNTHRQCCRHCIPLPDDGCTLTSWSL